MAPVAYSVSNAAHFAGAVALVNSLRLTGWSDEIVIVDCGLAADQRRLLGREARIVPAPEAVPPHFLKVVGPLSVPAEVMVVLDADIVLTRALDPLLVDATESGRLVAVADILADRFDARWAELLALGTVRRQTYVNSGLLVVPGGLGTKLFEEWRRGQQLIDPEYSMLARGTPSDPFFFLDQDVLNALLASPRFRPEQIQVLDHCVAPNPPFAGLRVLDEQRLRVVRDDGADPFALHHIQRKPWLSPLAPNVYSQLLPRLWFDPDLPLRLAPSQVPLRFRPGRAGALGSRCTAARVAVDRARPRLGIRPKLARRLQHRAAAARRPVDPSTLWLRVEELTGAAPMLVDLAAHRIESFDVRRRRRLGLPIPRELGHAELAAVATCLGAESTLRAARAAYDGRMLLFKGYEVALRYPEPWMRPFRDVDLLVDHAGAAQAALIDAGFVEVGDPPIFDGIHHLRPLWQPGSLLVIELHHALKWPDGMQPPDATGLLDVGIPSRCGVEGILTFPDDVHALVVAAHSWSHRPLRRLLDLIDVTALARGLDRRRLRGLADELGIGHIWSTTITVADDVLGEGRPTVSSRTWARHLQSARERTVFESHVERLMSPFWAHPLPRAVRTATPRLLNEMRPALDEGWSDKSGRARRATRNAFVRRSEHDAQLGPAADRRSRR
ncbi:MAG TPA: nucleotidyltransferase family protein [Gaiellaceae bacterium]